MQISEYYNFLDDLKDTANIGELLSGSILLGLLNKEKLTGRTKLYSILPKDLADEYKSGGSIKDFIGVKRKNYRDYLGENFSNKDKVNIEANVPLWEHKYKNNFTDKEISKHFLKNKSKKANNYDELAKDYAKNLVKGEVVGVKDLKSEHIVGSKDYKGLSVNELYRYIKKHPKIFFKEVGKGLGGLGLMTHGGYSLYNRIKNK